MEFLMWVPPSLYALCCYKKKYLTLGNVKKRSLFGSQFWWDCASVLERALSSLTAWQRCGKGTSQPHAKGTRELTTHFLRTNLLFISHGTHSLDKALTHSCG
jgi:hypothetical protein